MAAQDEYEFLRAMLPATVTITLSGDVITLTQAGAALPFVIECSGDRFLIGQPKRGGMQVQVSEPRVELSRAEMRQRALNWHRTNKLAS
jgi:hypothetical protein